MYGSKAYNGQSYDESINKNAIDMRCLRLMCCGTMYIRVKNVEFHKDSTVDVFILFIYTLLK